MCLAHGLEHCRQNVFNAVVALTCLYVVWAEGVGLGKGPLQSPLALIDGQGKISSTREVISRVGMAGNGSKDGIIRVFGILNSKGTKCCDILERIMGLELTPWAPKMTNNNTEEDRTPPSVVLRIFEGTTLLECEAVGSDVDSRAAALVSQFSNSIIINMWRSDLGRDVTWNSRALKAVFSTVLKSLTAEGCSDGGDEKVQKEAEDDEPGENTTKLQDIILLVHYCDANEDLEAIKRAVLMDMGAIWTEAASDYGVNGEKMLEKSFNVRVVPLAHPIYQMDEFKRGCDELGILLRQVPLESQVSGWGARVVAAWTAQKRKPPPFPGRQEMERICAVNKAYTEGCTNFVKSISAWWRAVEAGRSIPGFGNAADKLMEIIISDYETAACPFGTIALYSRRREELESTVGKDISSLFQRQVKLLAAETLRGYKRRLLKLHHAESLTEDSDASLLRETLCEFESSAAELQPTCVDTTFETEYEELEGDICDFSDRFSQSPAAQLKSLKKIEKKLAPGKDTEPYLTAGLNLVTYLRTPGYGNLQIFGGARAGTNTISFGFSNDGPTADKEGRGENPPPVFRIQPKIAIDGSL